VILGCYRNSPTERPRTCRRWGAFTEYPSESAVAPMSKSEKGMTTPWLRCWRRALLRLGIDGQVGQQLVEEGLAIRAEVFGFAR